jgi:hypothetical protein
MPEGIATGAGSEAVMGGALGWLAGIGALLRRRSFHRSRTYHRHAQRPGCGRCAVGGTAGGLIGAGMPEYEAKRYEGRIKARGHPALGSL